MAPRRRYFRPYCQCRSAGDNGHEETRIYLNEGAETPDRKRKSEEAEEESRRALGIRREGVELLKLEAEARVLQMTGIDKYQTMLVTFGLDRNPGVRAVVLDAVANVFVQPGAAPISVVESKPCTLNTYMTQNGIRTPNVSALGRLVATAYRNEFKKDPDATPVLVNGDVCDVKVYDEAWLAQCVGRVCEVR